MTEALLQVQGVVGVGEAVQWVVLVKMFAFAGVEYASEVAGFVVVVVALVEGVVLVDDRVGMQALLVVVVVMAEQLALLALLFAAFAEQV